MASGMDRDNVLVLVEKLGNRPVRLSQILRKSKKIDKVTLNERLWEQSSEGDVLLLGCDGIEIPLFKCLLVRSPYFDAKLSGRWKETSNDVIECNYSGSAIKVFARFCCGLWGSSLELDFENLGDVLQLATEYNVAQLRSYAETFVIQKLKQVDRESIADLKNLAELLDLTRLLHAIKKY
jgi:hypothetical protein